MPVFSAQSTDDVVAAVDHARGRGLPLVVSARAVAGPGPVDDVVVVDLSGLAGVAVDARAGTATVGGGATWTPVLAAAGAHGLAPVLADDVGAGVVGDVLTGDFGWLARLHGRSRDAVREAEVVTGAGERVRTTPTERPELLRDLRRGDAGGVAAVTSLTLCLVPVADVDAGDLRYPASMAPEVLARYAAWVPDLPVEMTTSVVVEGAADRPAALVRACFAGPAAAGEELVGSWRRWSEPTADAFRSRPFATIGDLGPPSAGPGSPSVPVERLWLKGLTDGVVDLLLAAVLPVDGSGVALRAEVRHLAGALGHGTEPVPAEATDLLLRVTGTAPTPAGEAAVARRLADLARALAAHGATTATPGR